MKIKTSQLKIIIENYLNEDKKSEKKKREKEAKKRLKQSERKKRKHGNQIEYKDMQDVKFFLNAVRRKLKGDEYFDQRELIDDVIAAAEEGNNRSALIDLEDLASELENDLRPQESKKLEKAIEIVRGYQTGKKGDFLDDRAERPEEEETQDPITSPHILLSDMSKEERRKYIDKHITNDDMYIVENSPNLSRLISKFLKSNNTVKRIRKGNKSLKRKITMIKDEVTAKFRSVDEFSINDVRDSKRLHMLIYFLAKYAGNDYDSIAEAYSRKLALERLTGLENAGYQSDIFKNIRKEIKILTDKHLDIVEKIKKDANVANPNAEEKWTDELSDFNTLTAYVNKVRELKEDDPKGLPGINNALHLFAQDIIFDYMEIEKAYNYTDGDTFKTFKDILSEVNDQIKLIEKEIEDNSDTKKYDQDYHEKYVQFREDDYNAGAIRIDDFLNVDENEVKSQNLTVTDILSPSEDEPEDEPVDEPADEPVDDDEEGDEEGDGMSDEEQQELDDQESQDYEDDIRTDQDPIGTRGNASYMYSDAEDEPEDEPVDEPEDEPVDEPESLEDILSKAWKKRKAKTRESWWKSKETPGLEQYKSKYIKSLPPGGKHILYGNNVMGSKRNWEESGFEEKFVPFLKARANRKVNDSLTLDRYDSASGGIPLYSVFLPHEVQIPDINEFRKMHKKATQNQELVLSHDELIKMCKKLKSAAKILAKNKCFLAQTIIKADPKKLGPILLKANEEGIYDDEIDLSPRSGDADFLTRTYYQKTLNKENGISLKDISRNEGFIVADPYAGIGVIFTKGLFKNTIKPFFYEIGGNDTKPKLIVKSNQSSITENLKWFYQ